MPDWAYGAGQAEVIRAVQKEMRFFDAIMADHGRVIRGMLDLGEDPFIREGDRFAAAFTELNRKAGHAELGDDQTAMLVGETAPLVEELIAFKRELRRLLELCRIQAIFGPELMDHVRREALWYQGMLDLALGRPTPRRRDLELPDGETRALLLPRRLIGRVPADHLNAVSMEYTLFWVEIHAEHAAILAQHVRPVVQRPLHRELTDWAEILARLRAEGRRVFTPLETEAERRTPALKREVARYNREVSDRLTGFRNYLIRLVEELRHCRVPTGQVNFWPAMAHHMRREADYLLDALRRITAAAAGEVLADDPTQLAVEEE